MSRRHNTRHPERGRSRYPLRLIKRGLSNTQVHMERLDDLRRRQEKRIAETGPPWTTGAAEDQATA